MPCRSLRAARVVAMRWLLTFMRANDLRERASKEKAAVSLCGLAAEVTHSFLPHSHLKEGN